MADPMPVTAEREPAGRYEGMLRAGVPKARVATGRLRAGPSTPAARRALEQRAPVETLAWAAHRRLGRLVRRQGARLALRAVQLAQAVVSSTHARPSRTPTA